MNIQKYFEIEQQCDIAKQRNSSFDLKINRNNIGNNDNDIEYNGNIVYKFKVINSTPQRFDILTSQMKFRLLEGHGQCIYEIGIEENGNPLGLSEEDLKISIANLTDIADKVNAKISCFNFFKGKIGTIAEVLIKQISVISPNQVEIKIGLIGKENSGKSTLVKNSFRVDRCVGSREK